MLPRHKKKDHDTVSELIYIKIKRTETNGQNEQQEVAVSKSSRNSLLLNLDKKGRFLV